MKQHNHGITYTVDTTIDTITKYDQIVYQDGVKVVIEPTAQFTLLGSQIDYDPLSRSGFVFNNPNVTLALPSEQGDSFHL